MKHSKFNYTYETEKGVVLYNTFSKALIELSLEEFQHFTNGDFGEYKGTFYDNGYIVEDGFDELEYLKYIHYRTRFSSDVMTLTIAPTLDCNFDCPYCFEDKRKGYMSVSVQRAVVEFIKRQITSGIKTIDLTWYGGEPLLYIDIIKCIYDGIIDPIKDNNVELKQFLITNGFLLTPNTISVLEHCGIRHIQITLDGKESDHDKRRYLRDGSGTFSTIMNNIMNLRGKDFILDIRSNIDSENAKGYEDLERELKAIKDINVRLYPAVTEKINERNLERNELYMDNCAYTEFVNDGRDNGYIDSYVCEVEDNRCYFCSAELEHTYVIDEEGNVYKCWDEIGKSESICFNLLDIDNINYKALLKYMGGDPLDREECKTCVFLPICFGGCRFQRAIGEHAVCVHTEKSINAYIERELRNQ